MVAAANGVTPDWLALFHVSTAGKLSLSCHLRKGHFMLDINHNISGAPKTTKLQADDGAGSARFFSVPVFS
jgi:hypothetical protein